jgi:hypothetical protein
MKKSALFTTIAMALCAADTRAQTEASLFDDSMPSSTLVRRIDQLNRLPGVELEGQGQWTAPTAVREGRVDAVILGEEGGPTWRLDALTTEYMPGVGLSGRFVYGGLYGTLYALDGSEAAPILVQGEWARHGQGSPNGSLIALVYRSAPFPQSVDILGTLTGEIAFFDDAAAGDDGTNLSITGMRLASGARDAQGRSLSESDVDQGGARRDPGYAIGSIARLGALAGAPGFSSDADAGLDRPQQGERDNVFFGEIGGVDFLGSARDAMRHRSNDSFSGLNQPQDRPARPDAGFAIGAVDRLGPHAQASGAQSASDAGLEQRRDRVGTCGTKPGGASPVSGHKLPSHNQVGDATTMAPDGLVRLILHLLD